MIPWFELNVIPIGPVGIRVWGTLVAFGFLAATWIAARRAKTKRLPPNAIWDMAFWVFLAAIIGSRIFHVAFYDPGWYLAHPLDAVDPTKPGYAIAGGYLFGALAAWIYIRIKKLDLLAVGDVVAWGLPWGMGIGRIGCFLIHDHPGALTSLPIGVRYPDGGARHDLGLELSLLGFAIGVLFLVLNRSFKHPPRGYWLGALMMLDGTARFFLDFLRIGDARFAGLTPAQWLMIPIAAVGAYLVLRRHIALVRRGPSWRTAP